MSACRSLRTLTPLLLVLLALFLTSCSGRDPQNTLAAVGEVARKQQDLYWLVFAIATLVFIVVEGLLVLILFLYRDRPGRTAPPQTHGNTRLELAWTVAPVLLLAGVAFPTVSTIFDLAAEPPVALRINVIGHQFWWEFQYPDLGITTASELHVPVGEALDLTLESRDVIHSFWVPKLGGKTDVFPVGENTSKRRMWLRADQPGEYSGQCAELCGFQHANMRFLVVAQTTEQFNDWVRQQRTPPPEPTDPDAVAGKQVFENGVCIGCHTIQGTRGAGTVGPNLTHVGSRDTLAGRALDNTPENMARWLRDTQAVKPGNLMVIPPLSEDQIRQLVAYLESLR